MIRRAYRQGIFHENVLMREKEAVLSKIQRVEGNASYFLE
jgi:hypothetical protein